jgi:nicotinamidase-related amidase
MAVRPIAERSIPRKGVEALDPASCALLLWDLQHGLGGHALGVESLTRRWIALRDAARDAGMPIVRSRHVAAPMEQLDDVELLRLMRKQRVATPRELVPYMQRGSHDVEFLAGLEPGPEEIVIEKTTPSLFVGTNAEARLRNLGVRTLALAGVATDIGVEFTARHAMALGYMPVTLSDAVGAYTEASQRVGLALLDSFTLMATSAEAIEAWAPPARGPVGGRSV